MAQYDNSPQAILPRFPPGSILATQYWITQYITSLINSGGLGGGLGNQYAGAGSPEGVQIGSSTPYPDTYWDTTNLVLYIKQTDNGLSTGWQAH